MSVAKFQQQGRSYLERQSMDEVIELYKGAKHVYHNGLEPILTDAQFDILKDYVSAVYPNEITIGAAVLRGKVPLPYYMGSMNKLKPDGSAWNRWQTDFPGPYILSTKLDGVSALLDTRVVPYALYTRGNGTEGQNISHLIPHLDLPKGIDNCVFRGELIMRKQKETATRNIVSGLVHCKSPSMKMLTRLKLVMYEIIEPALDPQNQMMELTRRGLETVLWTVVPHFSTTELSETLLTWREECAFDIDGIIVTQNQLYKRECENPKNSFAFKMALTEQMVEATVLEVQWNLTKDGFLKPRVRLDPVSIGGVRIEYATAFHAAFVEKHQIGVGTVLRLIRSGDVIPHIVEIIQPTTAMFPVDVPYEWNTTRTDIVAIDHPFVIQKQILYFFHELQVDGLGEKTVLKLWEKGFQTLSACMGITVHDLCQVDGLQGTMAQKIYLSFTKKIEKASLAELGSWTNILGRGMGVKKLTKLFKKIPNWYTYHEIILRKKISLLNGFSDTTALQLQQKLPLFYAFLKKNALEYKLLPVPVGNDTPYTGKIFVFSGVRDRELEARIGEKGGLISNVITKNTFRLIAKAASVPSSKYKKAKRWGVPIFEYPQWEEN